MAKRIEDFDPNFQVAGAIDHSQYDFYPLKDSDVLRLYGVFFENGCYRRLPEAVAKSVSEGVVGLHTHTAGGRVRFRTNSSKIAVVANLHQLGKMPHFALSGSIGMDLYATVDGQEQYVNTYIPPFGITAGYEGALAVSCTGKTRTYTLNLPLYTGVTELYIGVDKGATLLAPDTEYCNTLPVVFYGSSITQGGCASRPGTCYQAFLSRKFNFDYINLGFSGNAKGEIAIAEYIADLPMSFFVYDYDHNSTVEELAINHKRMFDIIRKKNPTLPILMMSRPQFEQTTDVLTRLEIVRATYDAALAAGDKNVFLLDGKQLMALAEFDGNVDHCHPTDLGFFSMAQAMAPVFEKVLGK